jgi:hypothetical protein
MSTLTKVMVNGLAILLISGHSVLAKSNHGKTAQASQPIITLGPCALPTLDVLNRLPWFIKASDVVCMTVTADDIQASERARMLLMNMGTQLQNESRFSSFSAGYEHGIGAYEQGNYTEAVSHFQAAKPSTN